jgi:nucleoside-diphosphate-sugar epimerase
MKIQSFNGLRKSRTPPSWRAETKVSGKHEVENWGGGNQTRSFLFLDDCIEGIQKIMDIPEPINLGSTEEVTVNELVDIVEKIARTEAVTAR